MMLYIFVAVLKSYEKTKTNKVLVYVLIQSDFPTLSVDHENNLVLTEVCKIQKAIPKILLQSDLL